MGRQLARAVMCLSLVAVAMAGLFGGLSPAAASCSSESGPDGSAVIFVGTADVERRGFTQFAVNEVWAGPDLAPEVWVLSGQRQPAWPLNLLYGVSSSGDADFIQGSEYVVGASADFRTGACSVRELTPGQSAAGRPADVRTPTSDGAEGADPPIGPVGQGLWIAGLLAAAGLAIIGTRRRRAQSATR